MLIVAAVIAALAYAMSGYVTFDAFTCIQVPARRVTLGITGMIVSGFLLGSILEHLLP